MSERIYGGLVSKHLMTKPMLSMEATAQWASANDVLIDRLDGEDELLYIITRGDQRYAVQIRKIDLTLAQ